jgi:hypothetical protein
MVTACVLPACAVVGRKERTVGDEDSAPAGANGGETAAQTGGAARDDGRPPFTADRPGTAFPVTPPADATPLEDHEPEGIVPPSPLWAMKDRRREQWFHPFGHPERIRARIGSGDDAVYAVDDGRHHCMLGRNVGAGPDGVVYSLVTRIEIATYHSLVAGAIDARAAFLRGEDAGLSGTVEDPGTANVFDVDFYENGDEIPDRYLPPSPFIEFEEDLPSADR